MRYLTLALSLTLALAFAVPAGAQTQALGAAQIEGFLAALPELRSLAQRVDRDSPSNVDSTDPATPFSPLITSLGNNGAMPEAGLIAAKHGFGSLADWTETGNRTVHAFAAANAGADLGDAAEQVAAAVEQIRTNPDLTPEHQDIMLRQLELATGTTLRFPSSPQDIAAVNPYMAELRQLFQ